MKISELNTKSFLGGTGAAANSYVLINYEDNSTSEPVTYKASLQELGKAIANDLKLPSVNVSGNTIIDFKVKGISNGAYTEKAVGVLSNGGPSMGDVNTAISGLASTGYVADAVDGLASTGYVASAISDLGNDIMNYSISEIGMDLYRLYTQYTDNAVYGLASTGYVTAAVANAGGSGVSYNNPEDGFVHFDTEENLLSYYNSDSESYVTIPFTNANIRIMNPSEAEGMGPSEEYHLTYGEPDSSGGAVYAIADPWRIPGDTFGAYNFVTCDSSGHLHKVVAPSDSTPYMEDLTITPPSGYSFVVCDNTTGDLYKYELDNDQSAITLLNYEQTQT